MRYQQLKSGDPSPDILFAVNKSHYQGNNLEPTQRGEEPLLRMTGSVPWSRVKHIHVTVDKG